MQRVVREGISDRRQMSRELRGGIRCAWEESPRQRDELMAEVLTWECIQ